MEFPTLGENCQYKNCNKIDFLPLQCKCGTVFCREHFNAHCISGECKLAPKPKDVNFDNNDKIYKCSQKGCRKGNLHEMVCAKCNEHYCIEHRFHPSCPEIDDATMAKKVEEYEGPRRQFQEANKDLQEKITQNIRKALQSSTKVKTASKIHLMRIKQKALGPKTISASDRLYFAIRKPLSDEAKPVKIITNGGNLKTIETIILEPDLKDAVPVFINSKWTLGKAIDCICDTCHIKNDNNRVGDVKLRMFRQLDGYCISPFRMDVEISELVTQEVLLEGDKLIFEYIDSKVLMGIDNDSHIFLNL